MKRLVQIISLLCLLIVNSCRHTDLSVLPPNENMRNIGDFLKNNYDYNLFYEALNYVGLIEKLNTEGPFTVFAVPNFGFHKIGVLTKNDVLKLNKDSLLKALNNYILPIKLQSKDLPTNSLNVKYKTLSGNEISMASQFDDYQKVVRSWDVEGFGVDYSRKDINLLNGTVHELSFHLNFYPELSVQEFLSNKVKYSNFVLGLKKFGLWDKLNNNRMYTIFAPTNGALEQVGITKAWLDEIDVREYLGNRLFGAYILYNRHLFLSDISFLEANFTSSIKDDEYSVNFQVRYENGMNYFNVLLMKPNVFLPISTSFKNNTSISMNNRCTNGIIHQVDHGLVHPKKSKTSN